MVQIFVFTSLAFWLINCARVTDLASTQSGQSNTPSNSVEYLRQFGPSSFVTDLKEQSFKDVERFLDSVQKESQKQPVPNRLQTVIRSREKLTASQQAELDRLLLQLTLGGTPNVPQ